METARRTDTPVERSDDVSVRDPDVCPRPVHRVVPDLFLAGRRPAGGLRRSPRSPRLPPGPFAHTPRLPRLPPGPLFNPRDSPGSRRAPLFKPRDSLDSRRDPLFIPRDSLDSRRGPLFIPRDSLDSRRGPLFKPSDSLDSRRGPSSLDSIPRSSSRSRLRRAPPPARLTDHEIVGRNCTAGDSSSESSLCSNPPMHSMFLIHFEAP